MGSTNNLTSSIKPLTNSTKLLTTLTRLLEDLVSTKLMANITHLATIIEITLQEVGTVNLIKDHGVEETIKIDNGKTKITHTLIISTVGKIMNMKMSNISPHHIIEVEEARSSTMEKSMLISTWMK